MADHSKWFEITVAGLGVAVTGLLGWGQLQLAAVQQDQTNRLASIQQEAASKLATDTIEVQIFQMVAPHLAELAQPGPRSASSQKIVVVMSEFLTNTHRRENLAQIIDRMIEGSADVTPDARWRIKEATRSVGTDRWFAVLASLPGNDLQAAQTHANKILTAWERQGGTGPIRLYRTRISQNFAVVAGAAMDRSAALELVSKARKWRIADDAFVQQDKEWEDRGPAPFR